MIPREITTVLIATVALGCASFAETPDSVEGDVPLAIGSPSEVMLIADGGPVDAACAFAGRRWRCQTSRSGVVAIYGDKAAAFATISGNDVSSFTVRTWATAVVLTPGSAAPDDMHDARVSALQPERSEHRPHTMHFFATPQPNLDIVPISRTVSLVAGDDVDPDAFLRIEGPAFATIRWPLSEIRESASHVTEISIDAPQTMTGRVANANGEDVEGATVDLSVPIPGHTARRERLSDPGADRGGSDDAGPTVHAAQTQSTAGGLFTFDHLTAGPFVVTADHPDFGRRTAAVASASEPVVLRLQPLPRATGRVLRQRAPVAGAAVRIVPDAARFRSTTDPEELASEPVTTGDDGRFSIRLPSNPSGTLVVTAPDRTTARIAVQSDGSAADIMLGDIVLPDLLRVTVRLLELVPCDMSAAGPLGGFGLSTVKGSRASNTYLFELPEAGEWLLNASCGGRSLALQPQVMSVGANRSGGPVVIDVRIAR